MGGAVTRQVSTPVSALNWDSLDAEAERLIISFTQLLAVAGDVKEDKIQIYYTIKKQWAYIKSCMVLLVNGPGRSLRIDHITNKINEMSSRFHTIRQIGLASIDELSESLIH
jgi:hypothetical protein